ncbi:MAG: hypothetical protein HY878_03635 [Deltaproteobacteria bacterium]|nr:hypothetical protein [Deltaproteobacteria bacterium]
MKESQKSKAKSQRLRTFIASFSLLLATASTAFAQRGSGESLSEMRHLPSPKESAPLPWGKDPIIPIISGVKGDTGRVDIRLSAIIYSETRPSAIINNRIVYMGDVVNGQKVVDIKREYVILQVGGKSYKLELESGRSPQKDITIKEGPGP